jgi:uncharacterized protein (UPF0261 family)
MNGLSAFDHKQGPLHDPEGPKILAKTLENNLNDKSCLSALPLDINDPEFAEAIIDMCYGLKANIS